MNASLAVLSSGYSQRMRVDKASLEIHGKRILEIISTRLSPAFGETLLVTPSTENGQKEFFDKIVHDPKMGPLWAISLALQEAKYDRVFVVGADMPFVNQDVVEYMFTIQGDVVIPQHKNGLIEPLHAFYSKNCIYAINKTLRKGRTKSIAFLDKIRNVRYINVSEIESYDPELFTLFDIDSREDLIKAEEILENVEEREGFQS